LNETKNVRDFYREHPEMVSSPFGGVGYYLYDELEEVWKRLGFPGSERGRILEVGCGRAWLRSYLEERGWKYVGVDLVLSEAVGETPGPSALGDSAALPFPDETFDALVCIDAYEHFPDPSRAVREFHRVLKPGGEVFLSTPNYANIAGFVKWWMETFGGYEKNSWAPFGNWTPQAHERPVTIGSVRSTFRRAGFSQERCEGFEGDVYLALCPWASHKKFPERLFYRLQEGMPNARRWVARRLPTLSLHQFWRWIR
jgi:SAM-dependent methyltransferase